MLAIYLNNLQINSNVRNWYLKNNYLFYLLFLTFFSFNASLIWMKKLKIKSWTEKWSRHGDYLKLISPIYEKQETRMRFFHSYIHVLSSNWMLQSFCYMKKWYCQFAKNAKIQIWKRTDTNDFILNRYSL